MNVLFDTHAHLDQVADLQSSLNSALEAGVRGVVAVGTDMASNEKTLRIAETWKGIVHPAVGLHPGHLSGYDSFRIAEELQFIEANLHRCCAVGEVGLDYHKRTLEHVPREVQQEVFREILRLAARAQRPVLVHSRYAWTDALHLVKESGVEDAVFHWFTGLSGVLQGIMDAGYYVSITPAAEYHEEHRRVARVAPMERLLLETDTPVWYGRTHKYQACPADVVRSLRAVAALRSESEDTVAKMTTLAARRVLCGARGQQIEEDS